MVVLKCCHYVVYGVYRVMFCSCDTCYGMFAKFVRNVMLNVYCLVYGWAMNGNKDDIGKWTGYEHNVCTIYKRNVDRVDSGHKCCDAKAKKKKKINEQKKKTWIYETGHLANSQHRLIIVLVIARNIIWFGQNIFCAHISYT